MFRCCNCYSKLESLDIEKCPFCKKTSFWFILPSKCDICRYMFPRLHVHHVDGNHSNNLYSNKIKICNSCHTKVHSGLKKKPRGGWYQAYKAQPDELTTKALEFYRRIIAKDKYDMNTGKPLFKPKKGVVYL